MAKNKLRGAASNSSSAGAGNSATGTAKGESALQSRFDSSKKASDGTMLHSDSPKALTAAVKDGGPAVP